MVIAGPQASGKSTLAAGLAVVLRRDGERVALVELDGIAAMALPTLPGWGVAHEIFETVVGRWARTDLTCVIAEGSSTREEVSRLLAQVPVGAASITVAVSASLDVAFERAQQDPTRGVSRERGFLSGVYERWPAERARIDADVVLDTDGRSVEECVEVLRVAIVAAR